MTWKVGMTSARRDDNVVTWPIARPFPNRTVHMRLRHLALVVFALSACGPAGEAQVQANPPVQTATPNAPDQKPAFPQQTRAPEEKLGVAYQVETLATGLD